MVIDINSVIQLKKVILKDRELILKSYLSFEILTVIAKKGAI